MVTIPPRPTPPLPPRSSARGSRTLVNGVWENGASPLGSPRSDRFSPLSSPRADGFEIAKLNGNGSPSRPSSLQTHTEQPNGETENGVEVVDETNGVKEKKSSEVEVPYGHYLSSGNQTKEHSPKEEAVTASEEEKASSLKSAAEVPLPGSDLTDDGADESQNEDFQDAVDVPSSGKDTSTETKI